MYNTLTKYILILFCLSLTSVSAYAENDDDFDEGEMEFVEILDGYMDVSEKFINMAGQQEAAVFFAIEGIVEIYEDRNELAKAPQHLQKILKKYPDNKTIRNIVRFKLRDVYNDTGKSDLALKELETIIAEN